MKGKRKQGREKKGARGNSTCPLKSFAASMLAPLSPLHSTCSRLVPFFFVATRASNLDYPASPRFGFAKSTDIVRFINTPPFRWIASEIFRLCVLIKKKKKKRKKRYWVFYSSLGSKGCTRTTFLLFSFSKFPFDFYILVECWFFSPRCATWYIDWSVSLFVSCRVPFVWIAIFLCVELFPFRYNIGKGRVSKGCKRSETRNRDTSCKKEWDVSWSYREILLDSVSNVVSNVWLYVVIIMYP